MSEPFIAEIRLFGFNFAPRSWAFCQGQILPIAQNQALFSLVGTTYGGDGVTNFALPNLQGRTAMHRSNSKPLGGMGGVEQVTLNLNDIPQHDHSLNASNDPGSAASPQGNLLAEVSTGANAYAGASSQVPLNSASVSHSGGNLPHSNLQPSLALNYCICLQGLFPSRS